MSWRGLGVAVLLAGIGLVAGIGLARLTDDGPAVGDAAAPLPAQSPSLPIDPPVEVSPDPDYPPLARDLPTHRQEIGQGPFVVSVPVPDGWLSTNSNVNEWKWKPPLGSDGDGDGDVDNTYFLRITLLGNPPVTIASALADRIRTVDAASATEEFDLESQTEDTFTATYVIDGYRRLAIERFISIDGSDTAFANIAVIGRLPDRVGLADLMETVTDGDPPLRRGGHRPWVATESSTRLAVARSSLRTCTHSSRLAATCTTRSTVTPPGSRCGRPSSTARRRPSLTGSSVPAHSGCCGICSGSS